eukprot:TRINITY_DN48615_c0_g1_i1.p1 TRINITY_DN48615_c0_g1~~TRINITY_DN48615_c0_g1_i1.p1  ORF type:complete len:1481 (-),score=248.89 TRINITY_DN48615_c0_g1_i1:227-4669(-)
MGRWDAVLPYLAPNRGSTPNGAPPPSIRAPTLGSPRGLSPGASSSSGSDRSVQGCEGAAIGCRSDLPNVEDIYDLRTDDLAELEERIGSRVQNRTASAREARLHELVRVELLERRGVEEIGLALIGGRFDLGKVAVPSLARGETEHALQSRSPPFASSVSSTALRSGYVSPSPSRERPLSGASRPKLVAQNHGLHLDAPSPSSSSRSTPFSARTPAPSVGLAAADGNVFRHGVGSGGSGVCGSAQDSGYCSGNLRHDCTDGTTSGGAGSVGGFSGSGGVSASAGSSNKPFKPTPVDFDFVIGGSSVKKKKQSKPRQKKRAPESAQQTPGKQPPSGKQDDRPSRRPPLARGASSTHPPTQSGAASAAARRSAGTAAAAVAAEQAMAKRASQHASQSAKHASRGGRSNNVDLNSSGGSTANSKRSQSSPPRASGPGRPRSCDHRHRPASATSSVSDGLGSVSGLVASSPGLSSGVWDGDGAVPEVVCDTNANRGERISIVRSASASRLQTPTSAADDRAMLASNAVVELSPEGTYLREDEDVEEEEDADQNCAEEEEDFAAEATLSEDVEPSTESPRIMSRVKTLDSIASASPRNQGFFQSAQTEASRDEVVSDGEGNSSSIVGVRCKETCSIGGDVGRSVETPGSVVSESPRSSRFLGTGRSLMSGNEANMDNEEDADVSAADFCREASSGDAGCGKGSRAPGSISASSQRVDVIDSAQNETYREDERLDGEADVDLGNASLSIVGGRESTTTSRGTPRHSHTVGVATVNCDGAESARQKRPALSVGGSVSTSASESMGGGSGRGDVQRAGSRSRCPTVSSGVAGGNATRDGNESRPARHRPPLPRAGTDAQQRPARVAELDLLGLDPKLVEQGKITSYAATYPSLSSIFTWGQQNPGEAKKEGYLREVLQTFSQFCEVIGSLEVQFKTRLGPGEHATPNATLQTLHAMDSRGAGLYGVFLKGLIDKLPGCQRTVAPIAPVPQSPSMPQNVFNLCYYKVVQNRTEVYDIVTRVFHKKSGWEELPHGLGLANAWNLCWTWSKPKLDYSRLCVWQKVNHFPGNKHLTRKDCLKRCIERYTRTGSKLAQFFHIMPRTYVLPKEYCLFVESFTRIAEENGDFEEAANSRAAATSVLADADAAKSAVDGVAIEEAGGRASGSVQAAVPQPKKNKVPNLWIMKPAGSSRGRGIQVVNDIGSVRYGELTVIQQYVSDPYLIDGYKWDMRTYVTVTSFNPLEAFIYKEGFARFTTVPFTTDPNLLDNQFVHLTNSSIQRHNEDSMMQGSSDRYDPKGKERHQDAILGGTKIAFKTLAERLKERGISWELVWSRMIEVILKSLLMAEDQIPNQVNSFELFGYDLLLDTKLRIWLIEVNASPSMGQEHLLDEQVKQPLISDTIDLVGPIEFDRRRFVEVLHRRIERKGAMGSVSGRQQLDVDLHAMLNGQQPRSYGTMPACMGNYQRIAPGPACDNVARARSMLFHNSSKA